MNQADAAMLAGVSRVAYGAWERGAMPGADCLMRLLSGGFDVNYILGGSRILSESNLADHEHALLEGYRSLDEEGQAVMRRTLQLESMRALAADAPGAAAARKRPRSTRS